MADQVDIVVGSGPVQKSAIYTQIAGGLVALASFLTTITDSLPEGIDPAVGLGLTAFGGIVATAAQLVLAYGRTNFAKAKALVMAGESAYPAIQDIFEDVDAPLDPEPPKSDTDVTPPVEPA